ncbi:phage tail protein [Serratia sp. FS14]|nr:phage tail protein [Serratia sp. FS14]
MISLTNETGSELLVTWNVMNAFPTKWTGPSLDATSNEVAFEELRLAADCLTLKFN